MRSPFGVEHGHISKLDAQGSEEQMKATAHREGKHAGMKIRNCPVCDKGAWGAVKKMPKGF